MNLQDRVRELEAWSVSLTEEGCMITGPTTPKVWIKRDAVLALLAEAQPEEPGILQGVGHLDGYTECPDCKVCRRTGEREVHWWDCKATKALAAPAVGDAVREAAQQLITALYAYALPVDQGHVKADAGRELWYRRSMLEAALAAKETP